MVLFRVPKSVRTMPPPVLTWQSGYSLKCGWQTRPLSHASTTRCLVDSQNRFRAYRPQYFLPSIVFSIFINVTGTYGTQFASMNEAEALGNIPCSGTPGRDTLIAGVSSQTLA
jgi:hypothetical protein